MWRLESQDKKSKARSGFLKLANLDIPTPVFMPVGTNGVLKALAHDRLEAHDFRLILANTYHLYLRPGKETLSALGGLHRMASWDRAILTDSGGFQIFSLKALRRLHQDGVRFSSHLDGSSHFLTPEDIIQMQEIIQSDILMPLDVCSPPGISHQDAQEALLLTQNWWARSYKSWKNAQERNFQGHLFGIVQGNFFLDLRQRASQAFQEWDIPGLAIGGLSVGEEWGSFQEVLHQTAAWLPLGKPRYLMGIGTPSYILEAIEAGVDMFDCVHPTRMARHGSALTRGGVLNLRLLRWAVDERPLEEGCPCMACRRYSRAFLRHLVRSKELLAGSLLSEHNLVFLQDLTKKAQEAIRQGRFLEFKKNFLEFFSSGSF